ncbi:dCTP deaminase [Candidatus Micrarchaeota archaeon]|nr:dCTP deaminase [Candidatus Micrarchaeota archaeon]
MVLAQPEIFKAIQKKQIQIQPFSPELVGSCSVDFRLGNHFKRIKKRKTHLHITGNPHYKDDFHQEFNLKDDEYLKINPNELVLGVTHEKLTLDDRHCAFIEGRSRLARLGLLVHVSSSLIQPGVSNHQVLEIVNLSPQPLYLQPKTIICQIVFDELKGRAHYAGRFRHQTKA